MTWSWESLWALSTQAVRILPRSWGPCLWDVEMLLQLWLQAQLQDEPNPNVLSAHLVGHREMAGLGHQVMLQQWLEHIMKDSGEMRREDTGTHGVCRTPK